MVEIDCICCGAELPGCRTRLRPVMSSMCERCTRETKHVQLGLSIIKPENQSPMIH
jgi:hypothetical protein